MKKKPFSDFFCEFFEYKEGVNVIYLNIVDSRNNQILSNKEIELKVNIKYDEINFDKLADEMINSYELSGTFRGKIIEKLKFTNVFMRSSLNFFAPHLML